MDMLIIIPSHRLRLVIVATVVVVEPRALVGVRPSLLPSLPYLVERFLPLLAVLQKDRHRSLRGVRIACCLFIKANLRVNNRVMLACLNVEAFKNR